MLDGIEGKRSLSQACREAVTPNSLEKDCGEPKETLSSIRKGDLIKESKATIAAL